MTNELRAKPKTAAKKKVRLPGKDEKPKVNLTDIDRREIEGREHERQAAAEKLREIGEDVKNPAPLLICEDCNRVIPPGQVPVVLEWGKNKDDKRPPFLGRPILRAIHLRCDDIRKGKVGKEAEEKKEAKKKAAEEKDPAAKKIAKLKEARAKASESNHNDLRTIHLLVKGNPRKEGTWGWKSFNLVKEGMTIEAYLRAGGRRNDLMWDVDHKFVELKEAK